MQGLPSASVMSTCQGTKTSMVSEELTIASAVYGLQGLHRKAATNESQEPSHPGLRLQAVRLQPKQSLFLLEGRAHVKG